MGKSRFTEAQIVAVLHDGDDRTVTSVPNAPDVLLVNNAGYQYNAPFEQITPDEFRDVIETCLFGVV